MADANAQQEFNRLFREQANLFRAHARIDEIIKTHLNLANFRLGEQHIQMINRFAMAGMTKTPGEYRKDGVIIRNAPHVPPSHLDVPIHMRELAEYVARNWNARDLVHLSAFVLWRLNWVHPFEDGNGRTARAASYMTLCGKFGRLLPPKNSIIEQILKNRAVYYDALRQVDAAYEATKDLNVCCHPLEQMLSAMLKEQIKANL